MASSTLPVAQANPLFFSVPYLLAAGIGRYDKEQLFYKRDAVTELLQFIDDAIGRCGLIDGLPGTGKSSTLWYKLLCLAKVDEATVTWIHFNRWGNVSKHIKLRYYQANWVIVDLKKISRAALQEKIGQVDTSILVLDGVNQELFPACIESAELWKDEDAKRTAFVTMSNKIEKLHKHEEEALGPGSHMYCTQHSWTLEEFSGVRSLTKMANGLCYSLKTLTFLRGSGRSKKTTNRKNESAARSKTVSGKAGRNLLLS